MSSKTKPGFYAVAIGRKPGIYTNWDECKAQVLNYNGAKYKKLANHHDAESWISLNVGPDVARKAMDDFLKSHPVYGDPTCTHIPPADPAIPPSTFINTEPLPSSEPRAPAATEITRPASSSDLQDENPNSPLIVYTDGACRGNGQDGSVAGIGVWWGNDDPRNLCERCPGNQTNNRAELIAIIRVLETAPMDRPLIIKSDSQYSINCLTEWLPSWKSRDWKTARGMPVLNVPLIRYADIMLEERRDYAKQPVKFEKVLGHSGEIGNEGADRLANLGATRPAVPDRDWEDLIQQVRARMSLASPPHPTIPGRSRNLLPRTKSLSPAPRTQKSSEPTALQPEPRLRDLDGEIPSEELEVYANCLLTDDEFLREAAEEGLL
ncbi:ribonuclease H-like protein [Trametes coccinea BRFM310]|uniref:Ribonuclease H n=1 Tax=Trametes coccinea (strain BRFM310) TaxID=1353009 RepID=A0A1Y2J3D6_TRAC3|nr:ribonuclease H-like protein [Trametes coccinea BRFM310]